MTYTPTLRNHYNPCFWTALWNVHYYECWVSGNSDCGTPREQEVFALNLRADRILPTKVERVHYDKGLGIAEITVESMKSFCRQRYPDEYEAFCEYVDRNPESLYLDFESVLTGMEDTEAYVALMQVAKAGGVASAEQKGFLACALVIHAMRSHELMTSMVEAPSTIGLDKWEYFWLLKNAWSNLFIIARAVAPLAYAQWIFYRTPEHSFPLCDSPVMIHENTVMAVLSPRLLLEINLNVEIPEDRWTVREGISSSKYREFRRRSIANSYKEILFHSPRTLEEWRSLPEYRARTNALRDEDAARRLIHHAATRVVWLISGMGRVPDDFETWVGRHFDA